MGRKYIRQKKQTKEELFSSVVRNAIDFIEASLESLDKRPKNGIVNFYTSIELFLKARLMREHWTLIISKPEAANIESFLVGDFYSVSLEDAAKRLKDILNEPLPAKALENFKALGEHRNQIVHFAHTDYSDIYSTKASVVVEQWRSWYYLHKLLTQEWATTFTDYKDEIGRINERMKLQRGFINARFQEVEQMIITEEAAGSLVVKCVNCKMRSAIITEQHCWGVDYECMVCDATGMLVKSTDEKIPCDKCGFEFEFFHRECKCCPNCKAPIDTNKLIELCSKKYIEGDDWWEEGNPNIANCHVCEHETPSVFYIDGLWSCVSCFDRGWKAIACPNCNKFVTGDMEKIECFACFKCEDEVRAQLLKEHQQNT